jgi:CRISPR-associated protein Csb1
MANRLESTCWDDATQSLVPELDGLSYVRVNDSTGRFLTSSVLEAHRINSVYIENGDKGRFHDELGKAVGLGKDKPIDRRALARALFKFDVGSLLHGVFLESIDGRLRIARAISSFIEAEDVRVVASGGVKNDRVKAGTKEDPDAGDLGPGGTEKKTKKAAEGYGNVPFHRDEFTAKTINLFANIDLAQIRGYGLEEKQTNVLILLALFKLSALVEGNLRLRTACDLTLANGNGPIQASKLDFALPRKADVATDLKLAIADCSGEFAGSRGVTTVVYSG